MLLFIELKNLLSPFEVITSQIKRVSVFRNVY